MKLKSHDEMFSMLPNRECDICNEGSEYQAYIEIVNKAQIACLDCSYKDGHLTDREYSEAQKLEAYYVDDWTEAERLRKAGEAEFLKRMKGPEYDIEEEA
jgi:hypothetical protein